MHTARKKRGPYNKLLTMKDERAWNAARRRLVQIEARIMSRSPSAAKVIGPPITTVTEPLGNLAREYMESLPNNRTGEIGRNCIGIMVQTMGESTILSEQNLSGYAEALHQMKYSGSYKHMLASQAKKFLGWMRANQKCAVDLRVQPRLWPKQPPQKARKPFTKSEYDSIIACCTNRALSFVIKLAWETGQAIVDCCNILWDEVDMEKRLIKRGRRKTGTEITVPFEEGSALHEALKDMQLETIAVFGEVKGYLPVCRGAYQKTESLSILFKRLCKKAGVEYRSFHSFRSTMVSNLVNSQVNVVVAMKITGHVRPDVFARYATVSVDALRAAKQKVKAVANAT